MPAIVDAHHHIWRQADLPWLSGPMVPRIFGPYEPIRRDYPIEEFRADLEGSGVVASVYVQTNWPKDKAVEEAEWVSSVAAATGWPHAVVAYCDLLADDAAAVLERLAALPLVRGIRMQLHWHDNPQYRFAAHADIADNPTFRRNLALLAPRGWSFDLQVFSGQMAGAARLAADHPGIPFVLQHAGMLEADDEAARARWRRGMALLAAQPNVFAKLSGLGTFIHRLDPDHVAAVTRETVGLFGAGRCLFGSNFPIEKLWTDYRSLVAAHAAALAGFSAEEQDAALRGTAARVYRL